MRAVLNVLRQTRTPRCYRCGQAITSRPHVVDGRKFHGTCRPGSSFRDRQEAK